MYSLTYYFILEQEPMNITSPEVLTDNGVTKEFDPLRNAKEEQTKTTPVIQQIKCKINCILFYL